MGGTVSKILDPANFLGQREGGMSISDAMDPGGAIIESVTGSDIGRQIADPADLLSGLDPPKYPDVSSATSPPSIDDPEVDEAKRKERELNRRRKGRASTILTSPFGIPEDSPKKTMLGQ